jgi:hypothetical protein
VNTADLMAQNAARLMDRTYAALALLPTIRVDSDVLEEYDQMELIAWFARHGVALRRVGRLVGPAVWQVELQNGHTYSGADVWAALIIAREEESKDTTNIQSAPRRAGA